MHRENTILGLHSARLAASGKIKKEARGAVKNKQEFASHGGDVPEFHIVVYYASHHEGVGFCRLLLRYDQKKTL